MASEQRYVVLCTQLGAGPNARKRGDVVSAEGIGGKEGVERQLGLRHVRKATVDEAVHSHVDLPVDDRTIKSNEEMKARYDGEIFRLRGEVARLERELMDARAAASPGAPVPQGEAPALKLLAEKDEAIRQLQQRLAEKEKQSAGKK
jgi:predicted RNase H-like nuclease (RuvC/YqgF family)